MSLRAHVGPNPTKPSGTVITSACVQPLAKSILSLSGYKRSHPAYWDPLGSMITTYPKSI